MNVLLIDEHTAERKKLRSALERYGCAVQEARDGLEGLGLVIHGQPDVVISNTLLPRMDGFQLLWALKADPKLAPIPFIYYSDSCISSQEPRLAHSLGAAAFILKEQGVAVLWEQVRATMLVEKEPATVRVYPAMDKSDGSFLLDYSKIITAKLEAKIQTFEKLLAGDTHEKNEMSTVIEKCELQNLLEPLQRQAWQAAVEETREPFTALTIETSRKLSALLKTITDHGETIVATLPTHDPVAQCIQHMLDAANKSASLVTTLFAIKADNGQYDAILCKSDPRKTGESSTAILPSNATAGRDFRFSDTGREARHKKQKKIGGAGKETILFAEDDESVRKMAVALLQHGGYNVITAVDGDDAVQKFKQHQGKIKLLLLDLIMPKMNGNEAYERIKEMAPAMPVIFASGYAPEIARQKRRIVGNVTFISKPYLPSTFLRKIRELLDAPPVETAPVGETISEPV